MAKIEKYGDGRWGFDCPGCGMAHLVRCDGGEGPNWSHEGGTDSPTFRPSVLVTGVQRLTEEEIQNLQSGLKVEPRPLRCHSFVTNGKIEFLSDCTHALAGQTVELPEVDEN